MYENAPFNCNLDYECAWSSHGSSKDNAKAVKLKFFLPMTKISNSFMNDEDVHVCFQILEEEY